MSVRRVLSLVYGLGYEMAASAQAADVTIPIGELPDNSIGIDERPRGPLPQSSKDDMKRFFGGAVRVSA